MQKLLAELSPETPGALSFQSFLLLMRRKTDERDERDIVREDELVRECGYAPEEVDQLRELFSQYVNWAGEINLDALKQMFEPVLEIGREEEEELLELMRSLNPRQREVMCFPEFLQFMLILTQRNVLSVNEHATRVLRWQERKLSIAEKEALRLEREEKSIARVARANTSSLRRQSDATGLKRKSKSAIFYSTMGSGHGDTDLHEDIKAFLTTDPTRHVQDQKHYDAETGEATFFPERSAKDDILLHDHGSRSSLPSPRRE